MVEVRKSETLRPECAILERYGILIAAGHPQFLATFCEPGDTFILSPEDFEAWCAYVRRTAHGVDRAK